ncbi:T9SS type A sorting domain-containing protein, partial [bacterium]|nr:T9SS type A sorting domain-containing protein [bacterium]
TRLFDVISALQSAVDDADPDVSASAEYALTQIAPISVEEESASQPSFALYQNYPNPFNLTTTIPYQLDKPAKVRILIYNIMGQQIRYLVNEYQDSGYYAVSWNGENQFGNAVASGIYFCRIKVGSSTKTMRMLLLK